MFFLFIVVFYNENIYTKNLTKFFYYKLITIILINYYKYYLLVKILGFFINILVLEL